jgi:hypothetical protein
MSGGCAHESSKQEVEAGSIGSTPVIALKLWAAQPLGLTIIDDSVPMATNSELSVSPFGADAMKDAGSI